MLICKAVDELTTIIYVIIFLLIYINISCIFSIFLFTTISIESYLSIVELRLVPNTYIWTLGCSLEYLLDHILSYWLSYNLSDLRFFCTGIKLGLSWSDNSVKSVAHKRLFKYVSRPINKLNTC